MPDRDEVRSTSNLGDMESRDDAPAGIDRDAVTAWMVDQVGAITPPLQFALIVGGNSNLTYRVDDAADRSFALRRPPLGHVLESAHDMSREFRLISAMADTDVPVPAAHGLCVDEAVTGAHFYVMDFVEGVVLHDADAARLIPDVERVPISEHAIDVLAALHSLDPAEIGLGDLGRREEYVARQIRRWSRQWAQSKQRDIPEMDELAGRLADAIPPQQRATVVHGDFRLGNMIVADGRVKALLDWELSTLGDPLADLGYHLTNWLSPNEPSLWRTSPTQAGGFSSREDVIARYAAATGLDMQPVPFYEAFQRWRLAAILEGVYARYLHGAMGSSLGDELDLMAESVVKLARAGLERLDSLTG